MTSDVEKKSYEFGEIKEYTLDQIEAEILSDSSYVYLDVFAGSDLRTKENIKSLDNQLPNIEKINAYSFNYREGSFSDAPKGKQLGFLAQEIVDVYPEATAIDENGIHYVNYQTLVPVLLQAIKELNNRVVALEKSLS